MRIERGVSGAHESFKTEQPGPQGPGRSER